MGRGISVPHGKGHYCQNITSVGKKLRGYFGGELFPCGTNDRGPAGTNTPTVGKKLRGILVGNWYN